MREILKRYGPLFFALWAGLGQAARAMREEPWMFQLGVIHVHPFPVDLRFHETGFDGYALLLGAAILAIGLLHFWRQRVADLISTVSRKLWV